MRVSRRSADPFVVFTPEEFGRDSLECVREAAPTPAAGNSASSPTAPTAPASGRAVTRATSRRSPHHQASIVASSRQRERAQGRIITHVFHRYGRPIKSLRRAWLTACRKVGRPGLLPHDLRRSAVRNLERAGISRSVAMKLTGHKTEAVYRRYAIVAEKDLREAGAKLAAELGTDAPTASLSYSLGDISVTAKKERPLNA